jgi:hypothetical protein
MMRRASKVDANQPAIVKAYRDAGCAVLSLAPLGKGVPDLLVCHEQVLYLVEVKDPTQPKFAQALKPDQKKFHEIWPGPIHIVHDEAEALEVLLPGPLIANVCAPSECGHEIFCRQAKQRIAGWDHCNSECPQLHIGEKKP